MDSHYTSWARLFREVLGFVAARENGLEAGVCQAFLASVAVVDCGIADGHAEPLELCQR